MTDPGDPYRDWPYAEAYLLETLDPELIESHACQIVSRALNIGRVVGFVGAGVAMSYGRISWRELVETEYRRVNVHLNAFVAHAKEVQQKRHPGEDITDDYIYKLPQFGHIKRLHAALESLHLDDVRAERFPMIFQLCEQLDNALFNIGWPRQRQTQRMRQHAMELTIDERGHARQILIDALLDTDLIDTYHVDEPRSLLAETLHESTLHVHQGIEDTTAHRLFYRCEHTRSLLKLVAASSRCVDLLSAFNILIDRASKDSHSVQGGEQSKSNLLPTERYIVGALLRLLPQSETLPSRSKNTWWSNIEAEMQEWIDKHKATNDDGELHRPPIAAAPRSALVPQYRDPLLQLQERLEITRFLTTNYDFEIERLFGDQGYRKSIEPGSREPSTFLTSAVRDLVFDNRSAGDLIAFAARDRSRDGMVVHLHGRASIKDEKAEIIVTESDYQRRYLRTDESRDLVDDAIGLTFGANPMIFVGSNMGEDDILRPLRQFMSNPSRVGDRIAVAFVPAMENRAKRTEEKIAHLGRYGVYTIHFGHACVGEFPPLTRARELDKCRAEWLPWIWQIKRIVEARLDVLRRLTLQDYLDGKTVAATADPTEIREILEAGPELPPDVTANLEKDDIAKLKDDTAKLRAAFADGDKIEIPSCIEGVRADRKRSLDVLAEVKILNASIKWLMDLQRLSIDSDQVACEIFREARAHRISLQGAGDAILAVFTCARLIRVRWDWDDWKERWYSIPSSRPSSDGRIEVAIKVNPDSTPLSGSADPGLLTADAYCVYRAAIQLDQCPSGDHPFNRFYAGAPSQTFFGLISALNSAEADRFREADGRRTLLLCARRGLGKGHFFSALTGRGEGDLIGDRLEEFLAALSPRKRGRNAPQWLGAAFYNLSFSQEVMSAFDDLADLLLERLPDDPQGIAKKKANTKFESLRHDRVERLRTMLMAWNAIPKDSADNRLLIVINSVGILFDENGRAKNGQIKRLFDLLLSDECQCAPIDLVLISQDEYIPRTFREEHAPADWSIIALERPGLDAKGIVSNRRQWNALGMTPAEVRPDRKIGSVEDIAWQRPDDTEIPGPWNVLRVGRIDAKSATESGTRKAAVAAHILHEARAAIVVASYFPRVGLLMARQHLRENTVIWSHAQEIRGSSDNFPDIFEESAVEFRKMMRLTLDGVRPESKIPPKILIPTVTVALSLMLETGLITAAQQELEDRFAELRVALTKEPFIGNTSQELRKEVATRAVNFFVEALEKKIGHAAFGDHKQRESYETAFFDVVHTYDHRMRDLHIAVGGGRYLLTLMLAGAYETTTSLTTPATPAGQDKPPASVQHVDAATYAMHRFLERAALSLRGVLVRRRSDVVIQQYLGILHRHHERGEKMPLAVALEWKNATFVNTWTATPQMYRLLMELLWHLSIIGQAVEADVLAWCPRIRRACDDLKPDNQKCDEEEYEICVEAGLRLGINRCLIFEIQPDSPTDKDQRPLPRYSVHGLVQRDVFQKLGAPDVEFTDTDQFTLSLYASQPDEIPKLNRDAHNEIAATIATLAGYPDMGASSGNGRVERGARAELHRAQVAGYRKRLLRAAFGIMRSVYSVAVLARFDHDPQGLEGTPGHEGYFEQYRRIVRWVITTALDLGSEKSDSNASPAKAGVAVASKTGLNPDMRTGNGDKPQDGQLPNNAPFFVEEIVWLYNECAVLSLVQGRLSDAQALFDVALLAAKKIEPSETGALHVRILVNKAVADIERGHGASARDYLERIARMVDEHPVPPLLAKGYLALIDHLAGEVGAAITQYKEAIAGLIKLRRARAASIFSRHLGDLLGKDLGETRFVEAKQELHNAIHFAQEGGHEDIRHMALLSLARCQLRESENVDTTEIHNVLDNVERYARLVGMPRLLCELNLIRARLLLLQGEVRLAGSLATQSLQIATVNDLRIRKIGSLLLLAEIHLKRNEPDVVRPLLQLGAKMAKSCNHFFALTSAQKFEHLMDQISV